MLEVLDNGNEEVRKIIAYLMEKDGKMLRPRLVFHSSLLFPCSQELIIDIAAAVELIHMASLVHDDVIDASPLRRGRKSLNACFGNQVSVLTGDYLFATAFYLINLHDIKEVMTEITTAIQNMCAGEIKQMSLAFRPDISEEEYWEKTYGKTACLFASSCKVGALATSMSPDQVMNLQQYGLCLGFAYQILDDILDFVSDDERLGKPVGQDLREGNITLPVIYLLKNSAYADWLSSVLKKRSISEAEMVQIIEILLNSEAISYSLHRSLQCLKQGLAFLRKLPDCAARRELENIGIYLWEGYYKKLSHYCREDDSKEVRECLIQSV